MNTNIRRLRVRFITVASVALLASAAHAGVPLAPSQKACQLDSQIDWSRAKLIVVQDAGRYKTMDSFAREAMYAMYGAEHLPGLSPMGSLMEWLFNHDAYVDEPVLYIKDKGLRVHIGTLRPPAERSYILLNGFLTPRQFSDRAIRERIQELEPRFEMGSAIRRLRDAQIVLEVPDELLRIVPAPDGDRDALWHTILEVVPNLPMDLRQQAGMGNVRVPTEPIPGMSSEGALAVLVPWAGIQQAWLRGDAATVQQQLDKLAEVLPTLAAPGVYPSRSQRAAEAKYYAMGKFTWGWLLYLVAAMAAFWAVVTGWKTPWYSAVVLLVCAMVIHAVGVSLRWYILGRIPVANMFEAIVGSAFLAIAAALVCELVFRMRGLFLLGASVAGAFALIVAGYIIPGSGTITTIMGILDDVMLRIHTVMIITSYAMIFVAAVISVMYLFGYYMHTNAARSAIAGFAAAMIGSIVWILSDRAFTTSPADIAEIVHRPGFALGFTFATVGMALVITLYVLTRASGLMITIGALLFIACFSVAIGTQEFVRTMGQILLGGGALWSLGTLIASGIRRYVPDSERIFSDVSKVVPMVVGAPFVGPIAVLMTSGTQRPIMAGGAPGDEKQGSKLPLWLLQMDWCQLIILNLVFVLLFVGTMLGAVWADYSWGRPWGWDPKEVFALNTWIVYAVLIHARFLVKNKGVWTAWLSVAGCLMMVFNWCFVNFFIVGMHSYA